MKKLSSLLIVASGLLLSMATVSCDSEYDLSKDFNKDISIGKNFSVPVGQTVQIPLSRIIQEGENISINNGVFQLHGNGDINSHVTDVDPFWVEGLSPKFEDFTYDKLPQNDLVEDNITIEDFTSKATYNIDDKTELPSEIEAIYFAEFNYGKGAISHITITVPSIQSGELTGINTITLENVKIIFPDIFTLASGTNVHKEENIVLSADNNFSHTITVHINSATISPEEQDTYIIDENGTKYFHLGQNIYFEAVTSINLNPSKINRSDIHFIIGHDVAACDITKVNGIINPEVNIDETLELPEIPDIIKDKDSQFIPNDMKFYLSLKNPTDMSLSSTFTITAWNNETNTAIGEPVYVTLQGDKAMKAGVGVFTNYVITNNPNFTATDELTPVYVENLATLVSTIPDCYHIVAKTMKIDGTDGNGLKLGESYYIDGSYNIEVPFSFDSISINYSDEVDNLLEDLEDAADLTDEIILNADAVTTIPVNMEASFKFYDENDNELAGIEAGNVVINGSSDGTEKTTAISLRVKEKDGSDDLERLEKIVYSIKAANSVNNIVLKSDQYLIIKNGVAKIPNGLTTEL